MTLVCFLPCNFLDLPFLDYLLFTLVYSEDKSDKILLRNKIFEEKKNIFIYYKEKPSRN